MNLNGYPNNAYNAQSLGTAGALPVQSEKFLPSSGMNNAYTAFPNAALASGTTDSLGVNGYDILAQAGFIPNTAPTTGSGYGSSVASTEQNEFQSPQEEQAIQQGLNDVSAGQYNQAIPEFQTAVALNPNDEYGHFGLGIAYSKLGDYSQAIPELQTAINLHPNNEGAYVALGEAYMGLGDYSQAAQEEQTAISITPNNAVAYRDLGYANEQIPQSNQLSQQDGDPIIIAQMNKISLQVKAIQTQTVSLASQQGGLSQNGGQASAIQALQMNSSRAQSELSNLQSALSYNQQIEEFVQNHAGNPLTQNIVSLMTEVGTLNNTEINAYNAMSNVYGQEANQSPGSSSSYTLQNQIGQLLQYSDNIGVQENHCLGQIVNIATQIQPGVQFSPDLQNIDTPISQQINQIGATIGLLSNNASNVMPNSPQGTEAQNQINQLENKARQLESLQPGSPNV